MYFYKGKVISISELGGPRNAWEYVQAHARILEGFDTEKEARAFIAADIYEETNESMECQFVMWLRRRNLLEFCGAEELQWNVSKTLNEILQSSRDRATG